MKHWQDACRRKNGLNNHRPRRRRGGVRTRRGCSRQQRYYLWGNLPLKPARLVQGLSHGLRSIQYQFSDTKQMDDFIRELEQEMTGNGGLPPILPRRFLPIVIDKGWPIDHTRTFNFGIRARSNSRRTSPGGTRVELPQVLSF